jgi:hypothetical protein
LRSFAGEAAARRSENVSQALNMPSVPHSKDANARLIA